MEIKKQFQPVSEKRRIELMNKTLSELMQGEIEELKINYPDSYKMRIESGDLYIRLGKAVNESFENNLETGDAELLKQHMPEVYKQKFRQTFGYDPKE